MSKRKLVIAMVWASLGTSTYADSALDRAPARPDRPWIAGAQSPAAMPALVDFSLPARPDAGLVPPALEVDPDKVYSLAALIDIAESTHPMTRFAWHDARKAALAVESAESAYLPKINASSAAAYQSASRRTSALGVDLNGSSTATGAVASLSLEWLLFDFGQRAALVDSANQVSLISNLSFTAAHQQLIHGVSLAFYAHAAASAHVETATRSLENARIVQEAAEARYKNGIGTVIEVAQATQASAQANLALVQARGALEDAYLNLMSAMGISPLTRLKVADVAGRELSPAMMEPVETVLASALSRRPDVLSAYAAQKASQANIQAVQAEFKPKVFVAAGLAQSTGGVSASLIPPVGQQAPTLDLSGARRNGSLFVGVTVPLFDGGVRGNALAKARIEAESADMRLARVREEAVRQIMVARNALQTSLAAHSASKALMLATQTTFDAALAAYRSGVGSITELTLAETQLLVAKNNCSYTYHAALSAAATLALSSGALGTAPQ